MKEGSAAMQAGTVETGPADEAVHVVPGEGTSSLVFDSPHSGRVYPEDFSASVSRERLQHYEDRYVDKLLERAAAQGVAIVGAHFSRAYIDPNRAPDDLDPELLEGDLSETAAPSSQSERGTGLIFRLMSDRSPIYDRLLAMDEATNRLERYWRPYHRALQTALKDAHDRHGVVWHINWHSMHPVGNDNSPDPGERRADFVLGDLHGKSCDPAFTDFVADALRGLGYSVAINEPFSGAYIVETYGRPEKGWHSLQIEINRGLYLDLPRLDKAGRFEQVRDDIGTLTKALADWTQRRSKGSVTS